MSGTLQACCKRDEHKPFECVMPQRHFTAKRVDEQLNLEARSEIEHSRNHAEPQIDELKPKEYEWSYKNKLKERRGCYSGHRELTLTREEVLTEFFPNKTLPINIVLKREIAHFGLIRNGRE